MNCCSSSRAAMAAVAGHSPLLSSACSSPTHRGHEQRQQQRAYGSLSLLVSLRRRCPLVHHATPHSCLYAATAFSNGGRHCHLSNNGLRELSLTPQRANAFSCHGRLDSGAVEGEEGDEAVTSTFAGTSAASATGGPVAASSPWKPPRHRHRHRSDTSRSNREGRRDTHNTASLHGAPPAGLRGSTRPSSAHRSRAGHSTRSSRRNAPPPPPPQLEGKKKDNNVKTAPPHGQQRLWSAAALVRHINSATDSGDWVTALRLCLHTSPAHTRERNSRTVSSSPTINPAISGSLDGNPLPPLHRLRKALAACEAVSHPSGAAWQGALALWHYAQKLENTTHPASTPTPTPAPAASPPRSTAHDSADLQRVYGRIFSLLGTATRWREALACLAATRTAYVDGFVVAQVAYALRASPARLDRAVLDLWAAWRCRVGDAAEPSEEMVVQLLQAMLHMTAQQVPHESSSTNGRAEKAASADAHREAKEETAALAATVATRLLSSAAAAHVAERAARHPADPARPAASHRWGRGRLPGTALPLNWARHRRLVHRLYADRWCGTWAEALCVGLASEDVALIRYVAPHVPASHPPTLYAETMRYLQLQRVAVSAADRAALWSCWLEGKDGKYGAVGGGSERGREEEEAVFGDALARGAGRAAAGGAGALVEDAQSAELLLDELLGEY